MARVIKFRGRSIADDSWVYGDLVQTADNKTAIWPIDSKSQIGIVEVYPESVGQYTNLLDRNKREIFEGDIVRQTWETTIVDDYDDAWDASGTQTGPVVIRTQGVCISPCLTENHTNGDKTITKNKRIFGYRCEVIGNKHDNPKFFENICNDYFLTNKTMKKYIGTKTVQATPAVRKGDKIYLPGDEIPKSLETVEDGYKVIYPNGYESWCPKDEFEKTYHLAETAVERMHLEYTELSEKNGNLYAFIRSEKFKECNTDTKALLLAQDVAMADYMNLLATRTTLMETGQGGMGTFSFGVAITLLEKGFVLRREGWNGKGLMVFKQVPTDIRAEIIPGMQSVPEEAKRLIMESAKHIDYTSQCLIYNRQTGRADSWVASISDIFAKDWELVTE